ncbi:MAG: hypothetical protein EXQ96_02615 [Alphaproteobacteria bacterium]|nr:hypothetical protein [Alphaproteobacteria bacterium]
MKALVLDAPKQFRIADVPDPVPAADEALIRIHRTGICATDVATFNGDSTVAIFPLIPGHELVGTVERAPEASGYAEGDWVTIYPTVGCGVCAYCHAGKPHHCKKFTVFGVSRDGGAFAERMKVPARLLMKVPESLRNEHGALIEPAVVGVHAARRAGMTGGKRVAVIGAGTIGSMCAQVCRAWGAADVILVDRLPARRELARDLGFAHFVASGKGNLAEEITAFGGDVDIVIDTVCVGATLEAAVNSLAMGGTLLALAFPHAGQAFQLPYPVAYRREINVMFSRNYPREDFATAMQLLADGRIDGPRMITATYSLDRFGDAMADLKSRPDRHVKVMIAP